MRRAVTEADIEMAIAANALRYAAAEGRLDEVNKLLKNPRLDPSVFDNAAVRLASAYGHIKVVNRLLADPRVDPTAQNNYAIRLAAYGEHYDVVKRLLEDDRVDPRVVDFETLREVWEREEKYRDILDLLGLDDRVNPLPENVRAYSWKEHKAVKMYNPKPFHDGKGNYRLIGKSLKGERLCRRVTKEEAQRFGTPVLKKK